MAVWWSATALPATACRRFAGPRQAACRASAICRAVGVLTPKDSSELHHKRLIAVVRTETNPDGGSRNVVKGYKAMRAPVEPVQPKRTQAVRAAERDGDSVPF